MRRDGNEPSIKAHVAAIVDDLPDDSSIDQILRELAFDRLVRRGLADRHRDRSISTEVLREKLRAWHG